MTAAGKEKVANYIFRRLVEEGVRKAFMVTGGGAMHLNDAIGRCENLSYVCCHHEQACAIAAESYARLTGQMAVVNVTTGPGGVNALNGVFGAWTDSIPMLVVSGQVKRETCLGSYNLPDLRQLGDQEIDIIALARSITKYAVLVSDPDRIRYHLEKAIYLAKTGRPGPCWLDIPIDVQAAMIDPSALASYDPAEDPPDWQPDVVTKQIPEIIKLLKSAKRPVVMVGTGIRLAGAVDIFEKVINKLGIPVVTAWTAHDLIDSNDPLFCGRPGSLGDRAGNFVVQNSDLLLVIGSRLNIRQVSYNWKMFAREAYKIQVDIDPAELQKPTVKPDMPVVCDAKFFLEELNRQVDSGFGRLHADWLNWGKERLKRYPPVLEKQRQSPKGMINPYHFTEILFKYLKSTDVVVCGDGTACVVPFQVAQIKKGQRLYCNSGDASMGYDLPAAVGAAVGRPGQRVICLAGDGSIQLNLQELQTVVHYRLPIKIFVLNNNGYLSIRQTQDAYFGLRVGEGPGSGVSFPDMVKIAQAYGIATRRWDNAQSADAELDDVLQSTDPVLVEVILDPEQVFEPKLASKQLPDGRMYSAPLEDLAPFLPPDELSSNMLIPLPETN